MFVSVVSIFGVLICGSFAGFFRKVLFQILGIGLHGKHHPFEKPWFTTCQTTLGCALGLVAHYISTKYCERRNRKLGVGRSDSGEQIADEENGSESDVYQPLLYGHDDSRRRKDSRQKPSYSIKASTVRKLPPTSSLGAAADAPEDASQGVVTWDKLRKLFMPSLLYQVGVITQGVGLRYTSASVNQMISGSCIIFTAVFSVIFLNRNLNWRHWSGLLLACMGIGVVSLASLKLPAPEVEIDEWGHVIMPDAPQFTSAQIGYGIVMTIFSQVIGAAQMVWEEAYITDLRLAPLQVMGLEGMWGLVLDVLVFMPLAAVLPGPDIGGMEENSLDTVVMLHNSPTIRMVSVFFCITVAGTSQFGIIVSSHLGSLFRAVLLTARTALIWVMDLAVFYNDIGPDSIGEGWSQTSPLRAVGFLLLLLGTGLYAKECMSSKKGVEARKGDGKGGKGEDKLRKGEGEKGRKEGVKN